jgi:hypothetical protein
MSIIDKGPQATLDYGTKWLSAWLRNGDTIVASSWHIPAGLMLEDESLAFESAEEAEDGRDGYVCTAWVSGGADGQIYRLTNYITTSQGRQDERSLTIRVLQR